MICVSIANVDYEECQTLLSEKEITIAEIRLDQLSFTPTEIHTIFAGHNDLIATYRPGKIDEEDRKQVLIKAVESGAAYVDLEMETDAEFKSAVIASCRRNNCKVIISYHNYEETPIRKELRKIVDDCFDMGADIAKVACQVKLESDSARIISLYDKADLAKGSLIAIGMGEKGKITRAAIPLLGAPFTYASLAAGMETAPGQLDKLMLEKIFKLI